MNVAACVIVFGFLEVRRVDKGFLEARQFHHEPHLITYCVSEVLELSYLYQFPICLMRTVVWFHTVCRLTFQSSDAAYRTSDGKFALHPYSCSVVCFVAVLCQMTQLTKLTPGRVRWR